MFYKRFFDELSKDNGKDNPVLNTIIRFSVQLFNQYKNLSNYSLFKRFS